MYRLEDFALRHVLHRTSPHLALRVASFTVGLGALRLAGDLDNPGDLER